MDRTCVEAAPSSAEQELLTGVKPSKDRRRRRRGADSRTSPCQGQSGTEQSGSSCSSSEEEMEIHEEKSDADPQEKKEKSLPPAMENAPRPVSPSSVQVSEEFIFTHHVDIIQAITTRNTMGSWAQALRCHKEDSEESKQMRAEVARVSGILNTLLLKLGIPLFKLPPSIKEVNKICEKFREANATSENKTKLDKEIANDKKLNINQTPKRKIDLVKINQKELKVNKKRTADEDGFIAPAAHLVRKVKNLKLNENCEIKINKQPEGIEEVALDEVDAEQAPAQPKRRRVPPFFVTPKADFKVMLNICRLEAPSLKSSMSSKFLKLTVDTDEEHRRLSRLLEAQGAEFKTFMLRTDRPIKYDWSEFIAWRQNFVLTLQSSNKPSWSGFLGKDGLHPNKSGDLRLANYFCRFLKKCISSDNASRKRKNCQSITPGYILDSLEFLPLSSCDLPSFLSSWPQHSGSALPCRSYDDVLEL
ncbi:hypothetical protein HNY73_010498 [Argiope bruennichi]|uniref:Uncharacterized protein n=1 Tax=Argiope bruennichi TaxID=94029 RepID=A0A8T0F182_ARGBR|nr:hypothetical protein HNY73_010498 [Argiope bruennichi]